MKLTSFGGTDTLPLVGSLRIPMLSNTEGVRLDGHAVFLRRRHPNIPNSKSQNVVSILMKMKAY